MMFGFQGASIKSLESGPDGNVTGVKLENGSTIEADLVNKFRNLHFSTKQNFCLFHTLQVVIGIGAKPAVGPFEKAVTLNSTVGGIEVSLI